MNNKHLKIGLMVGVVLLLALLIASCQPAPTPTEAVVEEPEPTEAPVIPTPVPPPDHSAFVAAWEASPHGNTYDLGKGPNTYCSRCHSPQNWDPASTVDRPPNCVTCKFPTDPELRMATTMEFVAEEDWVGIACDTCHRVDEMGVVQAEIAWRSPLTDEYIDVSNSNELCTKCHLTSQGVSSTGGRGVTHEIYLGGSAHKNWAGMTTTTRRPEYCSDCHDPHTQQPKTCQECHSIDTATHAMGSYPMMAETVSCMACHEASGMDVGPHPDEAMNGVWVPLVSEVGRSGQLTTSAVVSHSVQWLVACDRCHSEGNAFELPVLTADGQVPAEE